MAENAEIKIVGKNESGCKQNSPNPHQNTYSFNLSATPSVEWRKNFKTVNGDQSSKLHFDVRINEQALTVFCPSNNEPQAVLDKLKEFVSNTNNTEEAFKTKLQNLRF